MGGGARAGAAARGRAPGERDRARRPGRFPRPERPRAARGALRRAARRRRARRDQHPAHARGDRLHPRALRLADPRRPRVATPSRRGRRRRARPRLRRRRRLRGVPRSRRRRRARGSARERGRHDQHQLHERHDRTAEGRHVHPPRRDAERARGGRARPADPALGLPLDAADVPLQRLVLHLGGHSRERDARLPAEGRPAARLAAARRGGRHASVRRPDSARDAVRRRRPRGSSSGRCS